MRRLLRSPFFAAVTASVLAFLAVLGLRAAGALQGLELAVYDWHIRLRPAAAPKPAPVALVTVTEKDIQALGAWPLRDAVLAEVLETLSAAGARAVGLDIYRDTPVPPGHERLNAVLRKHPQIVVPMLLPQGERPGVAPPAALKDESRRVGFTDVVVDPGGTVRRGLLLTDDGSRVFFSLALRVALFYLSAEGISLQGDPQQPSHLRLGRSTLRPFEANDGAYVRADAGGYQVLLDYREPSDAFPSVSVTELRAGRFDAALFQGKVVLIGVTAGSVKDSFYTPHGEEYGVGMHARLVNQLIRAGIDGDVPPAVISDLYEGLWILLWALAGGAIVLVLRSAWRFALGMAAGLALLAAAVHALFLNGWWIPLVPPALAWVGAAGLVEAYVSGKERRDRAQLMGLFGSFVSPELADFLWQEREQFFSGGRPRPQRLTATVFFADVVDFTTVSEKLDPQTLMNWFYEFMATITPLVSDYHGVILRFLGDSIMAAFGPPIPRRNDSEIRRDAINAVTCALEIQDRLVALNRRLESRGWPLISMRIGILSGPVTGGSIGTTKRFEYNIHGDTVNTASRLESFDKEAFEPDYFSTPCRILIGQPTAALVGEEFDTELVGEFRLKGKTQTIRIHRVRRRRAA